MEMANKAQAVVEPLVISVRQPWAWLIVHGYKDIENRDWPTPIRGRVLIHASKSMTRFEYDDCCDFANHISPNILMPCICELRRGGIVGEAEIIDCVTNSTSLWFQGKYGFVLKNQKSLPFLPCKGKLKFFYI